MPVGLKVATARLARTSPATGLRSETKGMGVLGKTVKKVEAVGATPVRLTTTAVALDGTPARPDTLRVRFCPDPMVLAVHWAADPVKFDGLPDLESQMRTGAGSAVNWAPVPPAPE